MLLFLAYGALIFSRANLFSHYVFPRKMALNRRDKNLGTGHHRTLFFSVDGRQFKTQLNFFF